MRWSLARGASRKGAAPGSPLRFCTLSVVALLGFLLAGCGSSTNNLSVGAIVFSDANGNQLTTAPTKLTVNHGTYLYVPLANDKQYLGVDWSVDCGSKLATGTPLPVGQTVDTSCGTFSSYHTMSGPVPNYTTSGTGIVTYFTAPASVPQNGAITIYAAATADHTRYSSVSLVVGATPISVAFVNTPPATMSTGATVSLNAVVSDDSAAGGLSWAVSCASSSCGSFSSAKTVSGVSTIYTAPATPPTGGTVTITASSVTDPSKSASVTTTITNTTASAPAHRSPLVELLRRAGQAIAGSPGAAGKGSRG